MSITHNRHVEIAFDSSEHTDTVQLLYSCEDWDQRQPGF